MPAEWRRIASIRAANDASPDGQKIILDHVDSGNLGTTKIVEGKNGRKVIRYVPLPLAVGTDQFSYALSDNKGGLVSGKVKVTVYPDRPIASSN